MSIIEKKFKLATRYYKSKSISLAQSFLKSSLVPLRDFEQKLPVDGVILDLGCGEGILSNLVAMIRPECKVIGIDRDEDRLKIARENAEQNAEFVDGDILHLNDKYKNISAIILNDVVHHQNYADHQKLILGCLARLKVGGLLILKEVDQTDLPDLVMTKFFDSRLYPDDPLSFRSKKEWLDLLDRLGVTQIEVRSVKHFWPASRTVLYAVRPDIVIDPYLEAEKVGLTNKLANNKFTNVFITGSTGFLGTYLVDLLLKEGLDSKPVRLICLSRSRKNAAFTSSSVVQIYGDLNDMVYLKSALSCVEYIFHLAAEVKLTNGIDLWRNNYNGTCALVDVSKDFSIKRFIYASTIGAVDRTLSDDCSRPLVESDLPHPLSEYGKTKLYSERYLSDAGVPYSILRVTWAYGKGMTPDTHVRFLTNGVFHNKFFSKFYFPGRVSLIPASDAARAFSLIATHPSALNQTYFISDDHPIPLGKLFKVYSSVISRKCSQIAIPRFLVKTLKSMRRFLPLTVQALTNDILTASPRKLMEIGFESKVSLRDCLRVLAVDQGHLEGDSQESVSIVTGAANGIGAAVAKGMREEGHNLLLIDKDQEKLKELAEILGCKYLVLDLLDRNFTKQIENYLNSNKLSLDWVINNAGIGARGEFSTSNLEKLNNVIELNCASLVSISHLFLRYVNKKSGGILVNIGSSSGFQPLPYMSVYAASKSFVQSFTLALAAELKGSKIAVLLVDPSGTDTMFQSSAGVKKNESEKLLTPEKVAQQIITSAYKRRKSVVVGNSGKLMGLVARLIPRYFAASLWAFLMKKLR